MFNEFATVFRRGNAPLAALLLLASIAGSSASAQTSERDTLGSSLQAYRANVEAADSRGANVNTRELAQAALLILISGGNEADAERDLNEAFATQDTNPGSATYGQVRFNTRDAGIADLNAIEFAAMGLGPALNQKEHPLSEAFLASFRPRVVLIVEGLRRHSVPVTYTNIYLMKCVNLILLGQFLKDPAVVHEGEEDLASWTNYTRSYGIHEFDCPGYYATDLDSLVEGYRYSSDKHDREKFGAILDYFFTDIAANYFGAGHRLSGPYSRNYGFVSGLGDIDEWFADIGWEPEMSKVLNLERVFSYDNLRPGGYVLPQSVRALAKSGTREVTSSWDDVPNHERMAWLGQNVALGCTSGMYAGEDDLFTATFAGPFAGKATTPQISIVPDQFNAPYGLTTGGRKPGHQPTWMACVEHGGAALVTLDLNATLKTGEGGFSTAVLLPADAAIAVDGTPVDPKAQTVPVGFNSTISVTSGPATVAFRLIQCDRVNGVQPQLTLQTDAAALTQHAAWLKIPHLQAFERSQVRQLRLSFLFVAQDDGPPANAVALVQHTVVDESIRGQVWDSVAHLPGFPLEIQRSANDHSAIFAEYVNGVPVPRDVLSVNGKDLATPIWSKL